MSRLKLLKYFNYKRTFVAKWMKRPNKNACPSFAVTSSPKTGDQKKTKSDINYLVEPAPQDN